MKQQKWEECSRAFGIKYDCDDKYSSEYPEQVCAEEQAERIEQLREDTELADQQERCKNGSQERNQGLQYINNQTDDAAIRQEVGVTMGSTTLNLGMANSMNSPQSQCKPLPFDVNVGRLASDTQAFSGRASESGTSANCIDFSNATNLGKFWEWTRFSLHSTILIVVFCCV